MHRSGSNECLIARRPSMRQTFAPHDYARRHRRAGSAFPYPVTPCGSQYPIGSQRRARNEERRTGVASTVAARSWNEGSRYGRVGKAGAGETCLTFYSSLGRTAAADQTQNRPEIELEPVRTRAQYLCT